MMRIITGRARGTKLISPDGLDTRPTSERAKEAVFSMIQNEIQGRNVLDLFAGSGQLGLESVSRGAASATFCDSSKDAISAIRKNLEKTHFQEACEVLSDDYQRLLQTSLSGKRFDLVFLDPPYALGAIPIALERMLAGNLLSDGSILVCESGDPNDVFGENGKLADAFEIVRTAKYGIAFITILRKKGAVT